MRTPRGISPAVSTVAPRVLRVVAAVVERDGRYLVTRRRPNAVLPGLWEFPGGRVEDGESDPMALAREMEHRLGAQVRVLERLESVTHAYERYTVDLRLYACELMSDHLEARSVAEFRWVTSDQFDELRFTPADELSVARLLGVVE